MAVFPATEEISVLPKIDFTLYVLNLSFTKGMDITPATVILDTPPMYCYNLQQ